jgi:3-dehydroquinate synthase
VIGDMGGFCAATYKRGIDFIQVPTTLLAQVDASVGGKLGIDFNGFKNHIGVFKEPVAVLIATDFLKTLPWQEVRSGFAEIIKHCLIADVAMWEKIRKRTTENLEFRAYHRACGRKLFSGTTRQKATAWRSHRGWDDRRSVYFHEKRLIK